jgi:hypothetical protein
MAVPAKFEAAVAEARATHDAFEKRFAKGPAPALNNRRYRALHGLMKSLGLDRASHPESIRVEELTDEQRAVFVALTNERWISLSSVAALPEPWPMRRWLGLAPPGILEELGCNDAMDDDALDALLATAPPQRRVEAYCEAWLANYAPACGAFFEELREIAPSALAYARETLARIRPPAYARVALFAAFSASATTVPEGLDAGFALSYRLPGEPLSEPCSTRFLLEQFMAIAEPRRDAVLTSILDARRESGTYEAAVFLLERCGPLPRARAAMHRKLRQLGAKRLTAGEKRALSSLVKRMKVLESGGAPAARALAPRTLVVLREHVPTDESELTVLQARQLVEAGRCWDNDAHPAARRLSLDENDEAAFGAVLAHVTLAENNVPVFEAWLHGDSGTFFVAETTDVVAVRDGGVTAMEDAHNDNDALLVALSTVGLSKAAVRPVAAVRAATLSANKRR